MAARRPWPQAQSLDAAALALALCAAGWLDELIASLVVAQHCRLYHSDGGDVRQLANHIIPALTVMAEAELPGACARWLATLRPLPPGVPEPGLRPCAPEQAG